MGQSWERPRAGQGQPPQSFRVLSGRTGVTSRPSFPALTQTPCEEASKVSPLSATPGFLRKPPNKPHQPQEAGPARQWGQLVGLSGQSHPGPGDSVPNPHSFPAGC